MFKTLSNFAKALIFYGVTLTLATALVFVPNVDSGLYMMTPLVAVLVMLLLVTGDGYNRNGWKTLGLHRTGWRTWGLAVGVPLLVMGLAYALIWILGVGEFTVPQQVLGFTMPLWIVPFFALLMIVTNSLTVSLGEELGWRGYLLPNLLGMGAWKAALLSGFLWGLWHLPFMLLTDGYHADQSMVITVPLFMLSTTVAGIFFAYLRIRSGSVWPASVAHSAHNTFWALGRAFTVAGVPMVEYLAGDVGILLTIGYGVVGTLLLISLSRRKDMGPSVANLEPAQLARS